MKNDIITVIVSIVLIVILLLSIRFCKIRELSADRQLNYYGFHWHTHENLLPFGMKPEYWGSDRGMRGFVLLDKNEIGTRVYKIKPDMEVDSILAYGFNDSLLVALIKATNKQKYYIVYRNARVVEIQPYQKKNVDLSEKFTDLKWIDVGDEEIIHSKKNERGTYFLLRVLSYLLLLIYVVFLLYKWYKKKKTLNM